MRRNSNQDQAMHSQGRPEPIPAPLCAQARQRPAERVLTDDLAHAQDLWAGPVTW